MPYIRHLSGLANGYDQGIMTFGCSMGAMHAANLYYRRPDIFDSCFAISGLYDNKEFFGDYCDDLVYNNCPVLYLNNMPADHPYMALYNSQKSLIVVGQGAWEDVLLGVHPPPGRGLLPQGDPHPVRVLGQGCQPRLALVA